MNPRLNEQPTRRRFLASCLVTAGAYSARIASGDETTQVARSHSQSLIAKLSRFLWQSQSADGHWSSRTYALLRSGQSLTPFVLNALLDADANNRDSKRAGHAKAWIIAQLNGGSLGFSDPDVLEYPVYATAFALRCLTTMQSREDDGRIAELRKFLIEQQLVELKGFTPADLAFGGWGFGGTNAPGQPGHMDLSHTRWALTALATSPTSDDSEMYKFKAQRFLRLLQKHPDDGRDVPLSDGTLQHQPPFDGGFYFSPIVLAANKGRIQQDRDRSYFRSYATATCDGVISLLSAGVNPQDERVQSARRWLQTNPDWEYPSGIPKDFSEPWGDAVYFYHQAVRAEAYWRLGLKGDWAERLIERLNSHLQSDGSIANRRSPLMKENDPILCSTMGLIAATYAARQLI